MPNNIPTKMASLKQKKKKTKKPQEFRGLSLLCSLF